MFFILIKIILKNMNNYLSSIIKQFEYYKLLGEKTFQQLDDESLFKKINEESNSIAINVNHLAGNMLSRWTDFLTSDGEKNWRNRDIEFENFLQSRSEMIDYWNKGWECLFNAINSLNYNDLEKIIYIRNQGHTVIEAINRQLAHYAYHIGQIVYIGKIFAKKWNSLSIPKGKSSEYNSNKFSKSKNIQHFTDEFIKNNK
jgi:hypothetical protein